MVSLIGGLSVGTTHTSIYPYPMCPSTPPTTPIAKRNRDVCEAPRQKPKYAAAKAQATARRMTALNELINDHEAFKKDIADQIEFIQDNIERVDREWATEALREFVNELYRRLPLPSAA